MFTENRLNLSGSSADVMPHKQVLDDQSEKKIDPVAEYWKKVEAKEKSEKISPASRSFNNLEAASFKKPVVIRETDKKPTASTGAEASLAGFSKEQINELFEKDPWKDLGHNYQSDEEEK